ncbi:MAG: hypothetical protein Q9218_005148 [Villophora microphyllina]
MKFPHFGQIPIFLTSRQLCQEAKPFFWQNAHLDFKGTKHLVNFLTSIDHETLTKLRHIQTYMLDDVLPLFPGLQLRTLRVNDPFHGQEVEEDDWGHDAAYRAVADFIKSDGFQELTYAVEHDRFLKRVQFAESSPTTGSRIPEPNMRQPQPLTWDAMMKERDGTGSGANVEMFRIMDGGTRRIPLKTEFETVQDPPEDEEPEVPEDEEPKVEGQIEIRIKRGEGANYVQQGRPSNEHLHDLFMELTWKEILEKEPYVDGEEDPTAHL